MIEQIKNYGYCLANWDEAPVGFKTLFNFLTQSTATGPHREPLKAFRQLDLDFLTQTLGKELDL